VTRRARLHVLGRALAGFCDRVDVAIHFDWSSSIPWDELEQYADDQSAMENCVL
jgi:hypothetical protein